MYSWIFNGVHGFGIALSATKKRIIRFSIRMRQFIVDFSVVTYIRYGRVPNGDCMQRNYYDCNECHRRYLERLREAISMS